MIKTIGKKADIWHLIREGTLVQLHFDFEAYGLNKDFVQIMSYGDAIGDVAGNLIDSTELHVKRPDRYIPTPQALLVTKTAPDELDKEEGRLTHRVAMGQIAQRFETAAMMVKDLDLESEPVSYHIIRMKGDKDYGKDVTETVLKYPLLDDNGNVVYDVRIHPQSNKIAYRLNRDDTHDPYYENRENQYYIDQTDGSEWMLVSPRVITTGFRTKYYDNFVMRTNLVRAGFHPSNTFITHSKGVITNKEIPKNLAVDGYHIAMATHLFGPQGEEGLKISERIDQRTNERVPSAQLERIMAENSRYENRRRGVKEGITMPDGSRYDVSKAHKHPQYDSLASFALYNHSRDLAPNVIRHVENQAHDRKLRNFLPAHDLANPHVPVYAMPRNNYPHKPMVDPVAFVGFDDQQGGINRVAMIRLDMDLAHFTYQGRSLIEMVQEHQNTPDDKLYQSLLYRMVVKERGNPNALVRVDGIRKWPGCVPIEDAIHAETAANWDIDAIDKNYRFFRSNPQLSETILECVEIMNTELRQNNMPPVNPMLEEEATRNGFGDLDWISHDAKRDRQARMRHEKRYSGKGNLKTPAEQIHEAAKNVYEMFNKTDELLHRLLLQPNPVEWLDDGSSELQSAIENFDLLFRKVKQRFKQMKSPYLSIFSKYMNGNKLESLETKDAILKFRAEVIQRILNDDLEARANRQELNRENVIQHKDMNAGKILFANCSRNFRVVDKKGREIDFDRIYRQYTAFPHVVQEKLRSREWDIEFYRMESEPAITTILMNFVDDWGLDELPEIWQEQYAKLRMLYLYGPPNEDDLSAQDRRWDTLSSLRREAERLAINARMVNQDLGGPFGKAQEGTARVFNDSVMAGEAEMFMRSDEGQRFLADYITMLDRIEEKFPYRPDYIQDMHYEPETGLPYDYIEFKIPSDKGKYVEIVVPDMHLRDPLQDEKFSPISFVIPKLSNAKLKKIRNQNLPVILRGEQTGRLYHAGPVEVKSSKIPSDRGQYSDYFNRAAMAYSDSGRKLPAHQKRNILIAQDVIPVAGSRDMDVSVQSIRVPSLYFDGLTAPRLAHRDAPMKGFVLRADDAHQEFEAGKPIRFRETDAEMGANLSGDDGIETGHILESEKLHKADTITFGSLKKRMKHWGEATAQKYGYAGKQDMIDKINQMFVDLEVQDVDSEDIVLLEFQAVKKTSWAYFNPAEAPRAAFVRDDLTFPQSAYYGTMHNSVETSPKHTSKP